MTGICADLGTSPTVESLFFCGAEGLFAFDFLLIAIAMISLIAVACWYFRIPPLFSLFTGFTVLYALDLMSTGNPVIRSVMLLAMLGMGVFIALSILDYYKNYTR